jgi:hypothetical protein
MYPERHTKAHMTGEGQTRSSAPRSRSQNFRILFLGYPDGDAATVTGRPASAGRASSVGQMYTASLRE